MLAAGVVGPWLLRVAFGPQYQASSALLAWLTAAAVAIAMLTLTGAAAVAAALHRAYALGWVGATVASGLLLLLPLPLETRTVVGFVVRPVGGNRRPSGGAGACRTPNGLIATWPSV